MTHEELHEIVSEATTLPGDLAPAPKAWRRFLPAWLRPLLWVDVADRYDAFLSYSWRCDRDIASVVQSVMQRFLCPWYKVRAKKIFCDLACLPAGSSLEAELFSRLDRSLHLIVLASPEAARSRGMEMEARRWFSRERDGQVLVIVTRGEGDDWESVRKLVPPTVHQNLSEPVWVSLRDLRQGILAAPNSSTVRGELTESLKQILLRLYPGMDWGQLRGQERSQRRRAISLLSALAGLFYITQNCELRYLPSPPNSRK